MDESKHLFEPGGKFEKLYPLFEAQDTFMFTPPDKTEGAPHVRDSIDMKRSMIFVVLALIPCILFGIYNAGFQYNTINQVEHLFLDMYEYMQHHGLLLGLADKGEKKWMDSVLKGLGRFGVLYISTVDKEITGFAHGSIRLSPDYLGNKKLGVITHVHLKEKYRAHGKVKKE